MNAPQTNPTPRFPTFGRFFKGLFNRRTLFRFLFAVLCLATVIALFYAVENWRGRRAWEAYKQDLEARGLKLEWSHIVPAPVPDEENFFKAPLMEALIKGAVSDGNVLERLPKLPDGYFKDTPFTMADLKTLPEKAEAGQPSLEALAEWFGQYQEWFDALRSASKRKGARIDGDYSSPLGAPLPNFVALRSTAHALATRAKLNLLLNQNESAMRDLDALFSLAEALDGSPFLVSQMIRVALSGIYLNTVQEGLKEGIWKRHELELIQQQAAKINLLHALQRGIIEGELRTSLYALEHLPRRELAKAFGAVNPPFPLFKTAVLLMPRGWYQQNLIAVARQSVENLECFDSSRMRIYPEKSAQAEAALMEQMGRAPKPSNVLFRILVPNTHKALQTVASTQTKADLTQVACALERYRLDQGTCPEKLEALKPAYCQKLPHDIFTGRELQYRRKENGGYLLYSVGWNGTDDGGEISQTVNGLPQFEMDKGDWVWSYSAKDK